jgi:V8-like Glu-specific endopeptidase
MENITNITSADSNLNMNLNLVQSAPGFVDDLEGIVTNEPEKNKYETVKFHKLNIFPYFLIGKVVSKFDFDGVNKFLNGVGILIGPNILLTVAHNLCHQTAAKKILITKKVCFFAAANGDFNLFEPVKSEKIYIPPEYITSLKTDNKEEQLYNDWGLVYLSSPIGDHIVQILDVEKTNHIKIIEGLYQFFVNNQNLNLAKLSKQTKSEKISIVGYTEFKDNYRNNQAYKFLSNFTKTGVKTEGSNVAPIEQPSKSPTPYYNDFSKLVKNNFSTNFNNFNFANQGKLISELVNEKELLQVTNGDKKININININTDTEGLLSNPRLFDNYRKSGNGLGINAHGHSQENFSNNGIDYIILNHEDLNKDFDISDSDKLIMSESKGNLIGYQQDENNLDDMNNALEPSTAELLKAIKYQISTYKGQSGSPIFLRIKKMTDKNNPKNKNHQYIYNFIGLHSRRGPIAGDQKFYESEKMNQLTENMMTSEIKSLIRVTHDGKFIQNLKNQGGMGLGLGMGMGMNNQNPNLTENDKNQNKGDSCYSSPMSKEDLYSICLNNEIIKQNGMCEYNIALSIIGDSIKEIKKIISDHINEENKLKNSKNENSGLDYLDYPEYYENFKNSSKIAPKSDFVHTKIYLNESVQLSGLFRKSVALSVIFSFGAKIFKVPKEYILLKDMNNNEFSRIHNYNFDHNKRYSEIMQDSECTTSMAFELMLNIKKYGEVMSNNILQKFLENYDLEESQLKKDFEKKYMKPLFHSIFAEISPFENIHPTYGKLFKKIRKMILSKLELFNIKN